MLLHKINMMIFVLDEIPQQCLEESPDLGQDRRLNKSRSDGDRELEDNGG